LESNQIFKCSLLDTWRKSSSVNSINLVKKICYNSGDIEFFLGDCFLLANPVHGQPNLWLAVCTQACFGIAVMIRVGLGSVLGLQLGLAFGSGLGL